MSGSTPTWRMGTGLGPLPRFILLAMSAALAVVACTPPPEVDTPADGGSSDFVPGELHSSGVVSACSLLSPDEAERYVGNVARVFGSEPRSAEQLLSHDCNWWDDTGEGFSAVVSYGGAWDFSGYDDPELLTDIVPFDGLGYDAVLHVPNDAQLQLGFVTPDLVKAVEVRKGEHIVLFYGRQSAGTLTRDSQEFARFISVVETAMERVPAG
jgi:hypothetical protein